LFGWRKSRIYPVTLQPVSKVIVPYTDSDTSKKEQVEQMFNTIAPKYDLLNRMLSFGIDRNWRKKLVNELREANPTTILDVATGTADVALELTKLHPRQIVGIDISAEMLEIGRKKIAAKNQSKVITLQQADSENLPFESNMFDAVSVAYGVRNFEHLEKGLSEFYRVLRKGGKLAVLEFSHPQNFPVKQLYTFYFTEICPLIGRLVSKDKRAYTYLHESVMRFPQGEEFLKLLKNTGFEHTQCKRLTFGISSIYIGIK
jgi:demethylmenaquinone methyltransferase/2-methoxy-6-polyprenyl-1,4-benzoquinol methylase